MSSIFVLEAGIVFSQFGVEVAVPVFDDGTSDVRFSLRLTVYCTWLGLGGCGALKYRRVLRTGTALLVTACFTVVCDCEYTVSPVLYGSIATGTY